MIVCKLLQELAELATRIRVQQSEQPVFSTEKLILQHDFLFILTRIKNDENRMNEAALKVERIGEAVSIIRLRLQRVLQDCSSSLREINCGSSCSVVLLRHLRQTSFARRAEQCHLRIEPERGEDARRRSPTDRDDAQGFAPPARQKQISQ